MSKKLEPIVVNCPLCKKSFNTSASRISNGRGKYCSKRCSVIRQKTTHGQASPSNKSRTYTSWASMIQRCTNKNFPKYPAYGGSGIQVCREWLIFENFYIDMGDRPDGKTLDRWPNNKGDYKKSNCRWATPLEQSSHIKTNVFVQYLGKTYHRAELSRLLGIDSTTLRYRIRKGWSDESLSSNPDVGNRKRT